MSNFEIDTCENRGGSAPDTNYDVAGLYAPIVGGISSTNFPSVYRHLFKWSDVSNECEEQSSIRIRVDVELPPATVH
jgi:hypothetical protein